MRQGHAQHVCKDFVIEQRAGVQSKRQIAEAQRVAAKLFQDIGAGDETILQTSHARMQVATLFGRSIGD